MIRLTDILKEGFVVNPPTVKSALQVSESDGKLILRRGNIKRIYELATSKGFSLNIYKLIKQDGKYMLGVSALGGWKKQESALQAKVFRAVERGFDKGGNFKIPMKDGTTVEFSCINGCKRVS